MRPLIRAALPTTERLVEPDDVDHEWVKDVPQPDLALLHHAIRMLITHPGTCSDDRASLERLGDAAWEELTSRSARKLHATLVADKPSDPNAGLTEDAVRQIAREQVDEAMTAVARAQQRALRCL